MSTSRGFRNHNPLNIRKSDTKWQGMADVQSDRSFVVFKSNEYGYRAAFKVLYAYMVVHGLNTINLIINRWAPPSENNTKAYIRTVCERSGLAAQINLYWSCKEDLVKLVMAMTYVENGSPAVRSEVEKGYELAFGF